MTARKARHAEHRRRRRQREPEQAHTFSANVLRLPLVGEDPDGNVLSLMQA